jgi:hypothetical protein
MGKWYLFRIFNISSNFAVYLMHIDEKEITYRSCRKWTFNFLHSISDL